MWPGMKELKKLKRLWNELTPLQTFLISFHARWFLITNIYADLPYALRRHLFVWADRHYYPAHWIR